MGGSSLCSAGLLGVHVMWCLWSFLLEVGFLGDLLEDGGCDGMSLVGESQTSGTSLLEMSCCTCPLTAGCSPGNFCLGWGCPASVVCALLVGRLCVGCGGLAFVVGLWWGSADVWPLWCLCGVGRFSSLCGCDMMSGLPLRIYPYNFVSCISRKILRTLSIEPLFFPSSLLGCFSGDFRVLCH